MTRTGLTATGVFLFVFALGAAAHAQTMGMTGPGTSGMMGFGGQPMDHNLVIPQVAVGPDYVTTLILNNLGDSQMMSWVPVQDLGTTGTVYFYKQDGSPWLMSINGGSPVSQMSFSLAPSATGKYDLTGVGTDTSGWAFVTIDSPAGGVSWGMMDGQTMTGGMRVMASVYYTYQNGSQTISRVGVMASMYQTGLFANSMMPVQAQGALSTGVAIVNMGSQTATIQVQLKDAAGHMFGSQQIQIPAGNQIAQFVYQMFPGLPSDLQGYMQIQTSDEGVVMMGILMSGGIMTSIPMMHFGHMGMM